MLDSVLVLSSLIDMVSATGSEVWEPAQGLSSAYHVCLRGLAESDREERQDGRERTDAFAATQL